MTDGSLWASRERAMEILGLTEDEFKAQVKSGKILFHSLPGSKWSIRGRQYVYWVGKPMTRGSTDDD